MSKFDKGGSFWQVDQGVLLFLASDGLGRPIAALLLSDVAPPREDEEELGKGEKEEGSKVENVNEVEEAEKKEKEDDKDVLKVEKADIGLKERLELATGLEVVKNVNICCQHHGHRFPHLQLFTSASTSVLLEGGPEQNSYKIQKKSKSCPEFPTRCSQGDTVVWAADQEGIWSLARPAGLRN